MNMNKHEIWQALTQLTLRCLKYIKGVFNLNAVWHSYFLIPWQSLYDKRVKSLEKIFSSSGNATEHSENKVITLSGLSENEIRPGVLQSSIQYTHPL